MRYPYDVDDEDRCRFIIEEARTGRILVRDLEARQPKIMKKLSGPCVIEFDLDYRDPSVQHPDGTGPIIFKPWGHWCHVEKTIKGKREIIASGIFQPSEVDPQSGLLKARWQGFSGYPEGIPWLQNWNPIAVDPAEIVNKIWSHIQSYANGNLDVTCYSLAEDGSKTIPPVTNTQMLPGFSFDGSNFLMDFFAIFIRRIDFTDCGDYINKLARDIPFDYFEESNWNEDHTEIEKWIQIAYPKGGALQSNLVFRLNENVLFGKTRIEAEMEWASDIAVRGWFPGKVYSSILSNADPVRYRRVVMEEDARINSTERAAAGAHKQLTRRQAPPYYENITIKMYHSNARFGTWDVGDQIRVQGTAPWVGEIDQVHKIIAWSLDEASQTCQLTLRAEGAFNYDPIFFDGIYQNLLQNSDFTASMFSWTKVSGNWIRDSLTGFNSLGCVKVQCNGTEKILISEAIPVTSADDVNLSCYVHWENMVTSAGPDAPIQVALNLYNETNDLLQTVIFDDTAADGSAVDWFQIGNDNYDVPATGTPTSMRVMARILPSALSGTVRYDRFSITKS